MRCVHNKSTRANGIAKVADGESIVTRVAWNIAVVLRIASVAVQNHADNLVLNCGAETAHGARHDCCTLGIAASDNDGIGTLGGSQAEQTLSLTDRSCGGAQWESIRT